ncbi:unnamed protein product [Macrosiphum euphorbiae]|uniref:K Homology domain-containing protein n=1 Tax=Macrosiphum euphorbiae TaxID=13131 RepID=A0AAV0X1Q2_9HEMI|nr:unnamed protein product [Macrosiphum euphorbiae]
MFGLTDDEVVLAIWNSGSEKKIIISNDLIVKYAATLPNSYRTHSQLWSLTPRFIGKRRERLIAAPFSTDTASAHRPKTRQTKATTSHQQSHSYSAVMEDNKVEVLFENGSYYESFVTGVMENEVLVSFPDDWYSETKFNYDNVRLPLSDEQCSTEFIYNQEIEVKSVIEPHPCYWWVKAIIKMISGNPPSQFVVQYLNTTAEEIFVSPDKIRCSNINSHINGNTFYITDIDVPEDVREFAKIDGIHKDLQIAIGASLVLYNPDRSMLSVISLSPLTSKITLILADFRKLNHNVMLLKKTEELAKQLESSKLNITSSPYSGEFNVLDELMGLAIGTRGTNIERARRIDGITSIELDKHTRIFKIYGNSKDSIKKARRILEYKKKCLQVQRDFIGKLIGKNGCNIKDIIAKSGVELEQNRKETQMEMAMQRRYNRNLNADSENMKNGQSKSKGRKITGVYVAKMRVNEKVN